MSLLDTLNKSQQLGGGESFTEQASQMKGALTGKAQPEAEGPAKSNVAEQVAVSQAQSEKQTMLDQLTSQQKSAQVEQTGIQQQQKLSEQELKQKETSIVMGAQRQFNELNRKFAEESSALTVEQKGAMLEQMAFLNNLSDRKYMSEVKNEGMRRRLDDQNQMKEALMYAEFDDMVTLLNKDLSFKKAMSADERTFNEYLSTISPEAAISAAVAMYNQQQSQKAFEGMTKGIAENTPKIMEAAPGVAQKVENWWNKSDPEFVGE